MKNYQKFTESLELWFASNARDFPWRHSRDPYHVWISEIMSHQTQIDRVAEKFFPRFLEAFPTLEAFAKADWEKEVYPVWEGLGYYNRGKNMQKTAKIIVEKYNGKFPESPELLEQLPGIGKYTAHAILSFALGHRLPAVDTNISKIILTLWPKVNVVEAAEALIAPASSGYVWNSAMMDLATELRAGKVIEGPLGETFFPPAVVEKFKPKRKNPKLKNNPRKKVFTIEVGVACIHKDGKYLIQSRPEGKSFVGFWEFPGGKREPGESFRECVKREIMEEVGTKISVRPHFFEQTHKFKGKNLLLRFHRCQIQSGTPKPLENQELNWVSPEDFHKINFLKTNAKALETLKKMRT